MCSFRLPKRLVILLLLMGLTMIVCLGVYIFGEALFTDKSNVQTRDQLPKLFVMTATDRLKLMGKMIHDAKKHVRGDKTATQLRKAIKIMNSLYKDLKIDPSEVYKRSTRQSKSVCPETYKGTFYGYPFYDRGFETVPCSHGLPISELVTAVKLFCDSSPADVVKDIKLFVKSVNSVNSKINVFVAVPKSKHHLIKALGLQNLALFNTDCLADGAVFNYMLKSVKTEYVLVARDAVRLDGDARLERLVREVESLGVAAAGGAVRYPNGHWKKGCFQSVYRNYSLKYFEGYDESLHECIFCDYIQGPFVTSAEYLKKQPFSDHLIETNGLYEDWFLRVFRQSKETVVCPDSMFHVRGGIPQRKIDWKVFMEKWELLKIAAIDGRVIERDCSKHLFQFWYMNARSPCELQANADAVNTVMRMCEESRIICEIDSGTTLGAVKFGKPLPWEMDADISFLSSNYTTFCGLRTKFEKLGFRFKNNKETFCCDDKKRIKGGQVDLFYKGWKIEMWGMSTLERDRSINGNPTKVLFDGQFINGPRNPGLCYRNRYGREIYQHAQHWMTTGDKSSWINYTTNVFRPCTSKLGHNCLDAYNGDGNLQFVDMMP